MNESPKNPDEVMFRERFGISEREAKKWIELDQSFPEGKDEVEDDA